MEDNRRFTGEASCDWTTSSSPITLLERAFDISSGRALGNGCSFIIFAFTLGQRDLDLGSPSFEIQARGHNGVSAFRDPPDETVDLSTME
jgi:hypothetical protein